MAAVISGFVAAASAAELFAAGALAITAVSAFGQYEAGKGASAAAGQQAQAQKDSLAAQSRMSEVEAQRARLAQVREARIRRSSIVASSMGTGLGGGTSGVSGGTSSISSQEAGNIGIINQTQTFAQEATAANQRSADAASTIFSEQAKGQQWQTINTIFGADKYSMSTLFKKQQ